MSSTTPSATRNSASFDRLQVENGRSCSAGRDLAIFLIFDLPPLAQGELRRPATPVLRVQGAEPISVEVADHITHPVLAGKRHLRDHGHIHALRREQHHLRPPPGHHRPRSPPHDPQQVLALVIVNLTHPQAFGHRPKSRRSAPAGKAPSRAKPGRASVTCYGFRPACAGSPTSVSSLLSTQLSPRRSRGSCSPITATRRCQE